MCLSARLRFAAGVLVAALASAACSPDAEPASSADPASHAPEPAVGAVRAAPAEVSADAVSDLHIAWFDGSVEQAFATAAQDGKPVFLYWGAQWCPPCHQVQATVFRSREFVERSRLFVPVYLDGDTANAQAIGEKYGVLGYPTMIVLTAAGEEITRIPGGSDIEAYADVLDLTLGDIGTAAAVLDRVLTQADVSLSPSECRLLAYYSWEQDTALLDDAGQADAFRAMHDACPTNETAARSVLFMASLTAEIDALHDGQRLARERREAGRAQVLALLGDAALVRANLYTVLFDGATITSALSDEGGSQREQLRSRWLAALNSVAANTGLFTTERLYARYGKLQFERLDDPDAPLSAELEADILAAVDAADRDTRDPYARQSVINTARNVLVAANLQDKAKALLLKEIGISAQPYYFMVGLADIEQQAGNFADAIGWLKRAWDESRGPATRFQWGTYYVTGLIEMVPEEVAMIEAAALALLSELGQSQAFYQRPKRQLQSLERRLRAWNDNPRAADAIDRIRTGARGICVQLPEREASRATCESFLADGNATAGRAPG